MIGQNKKHIPVLIEQVLEYLQPKEGQSYLDLTAGYGGHAEAVLGRTLQPDKATLVDRDQNAIRHLIKRFGKGQGPDIVQKDYLSASKELNAEGQKFDMILADIGVSSPHLNEPDRGFSFLGEGPLDMRMDQSQDLTADEVVNTYTEEELAGVLQRYGEEPKSRSIAKLICEARPIKTTTQLAETVARAYPKKVWGPKKQNPATKTFQAIRIAVNDELNQLADSLTIWVELLAPGGRLVVISFHSLEDRIVKDFFKDNSQGLSDPLKLLTKKPIIAGHEEIDSNPRARSAKLRAVVKNKNKNKKKGNNEYADSSKRQFTSIQSTSTCIVTTSLGRGTLTRSCQEKCLTFREIAIFRKKLRESLNLQGLPHQTTRDQYH